MRFSRSSSRRGGGEDEAAGAGVGNAAAEAPLSDWVEVTTDEGHIYYHNTKTDETAWERPQAGDEARIERVSSVDSSSHPPARPQMPASGDTARDLVNIYGKQEVGGP